MQDDWTKGKLTMNLGVRYDYVKGTWAEDLPFDQWVPVRPVDKNNVQPRLGFAYSINDRTVARGGWYSLPAARSICRTPIASMRRSPTFR